MINYRQESLKSVLKKEYPKGIDCVYESGARMTAAGDGRLLPVELVVRWRVGCKLQLHRTCRRCC